MENISSVYQMSLYYLPEVVLVEMVNDFFV